MNGFSKLSLFEVKPAMSNKIMNFAGIILQPFEKPFLDRASMIYTKVPIAGFKLYYPKDPIDDSEWPENRKLIIKEKQPVYLTKAPKMFKMLRLLRGPEPVHNQLIYKGYGVKALLGGRLKSQHFEAIRNIVNKKIDTDRMFALWRVDAPWQPLSKKSIGKKLGGGKGSIHHYCTPVRAERIIVELGGDLHPIEAQKILAPVAEILPFPARFVSQKDLEYEKKQEEWVEKNNKNPFTMEYVIKNNMGGCHKWLGKYDYMWFGKYK